MPGRRTTPSDYERRALREIHEWKNPEPGWFGQMLERIGWPRATEGLRGRIGDLRDAVEEAALFDVIRKAIAGALSLGADAASWSVDADAIYASYRRSGHDVHRASHVRDLDLEDADRMIGRLDVKYKGLAAAEGAATGATGLPGIAVDVPALTTLNLRAICEYATYYGFDLASQRERLFVLEVLSAASSLDPAKSTVMASFARVGADAARKKTWSELEQRAFVRVAQQIAKTLGVRLTKAKLAQVVPITGAAVGGGYNAYFTSRVCDTAAHLYRERFLLEKHGPDIFEVDVISEAADEDRSVIKGDGWVIHPDASGAPAAA